VNKKLNFGEYAELLKKIETLENYSKTNKIDLDGIIQAPASRIYRTESDIQKLRSALDSSESIVTPTYYNLQQIYNEVIMDSEVTSVIQKRKNYVLSREFTVTRNGEVDEDAKEFFSKRWLKDFINYTLDSIFYGYSLVKIGDIVDDELACIELVPRQNTNPKTRRILETPYAINSGESIDDKSVKDWLILISDSKDTHYQGLFSKISTYQVLLKVAQSAFAEYAERFGSPNVIVKTGMYNKQYVDNVEKYLKNFNRIGYGIFSNLDEVSLVESSGKSSDVYSAMITEMKANINKIVLGSETLGDEKSFVGAAEISEGIANLFSLNDIDFVEFIINDELLPRLQNLGLKFLKGVRFKFDISNKMKPTDEFAMMVQLLQLGYKVDAKIISEKFGLQVENPVVATPLFTAPEEGEKPTPDNV
jgi:hypothetical protein